MLVKNMSVQDQDKKTGSKIKTNVTYLGITLINMNCMLFQNNYTKVWNDIKNEVGQIQLFLLGIISVIKMDFYPGCYLFQTILILTYQCCHKLYYLYCSKTIFPKSQEYKLLQDAKERITWPKTAFLCLLLVCMNDWVTLRNRLLEQEYLIWDLGGTAFYGIMNLGLTYILIITLLKW